MFIREGYCAQVVALICSGIGQSRASLYLRMKSHAQRLTLK
jgi:hypothetical protein